MTQNRFTLFLKPFPDGSSTQLSLSGSLSVPAPPRELRALLRSLANWSGSPISVVVCVDDATEWFRFWTDALAKAHPDDFEVSFEVRHAPERRIEGGR